MDTQEFPTMGFGGWLPNGLKVFYTMPVKNPETAFEESMAFSNALLAKGFSQTEPGLGQGEHKELIGSVSRRNKKNTDGSITPAIDLYAAAAHLKHRYMGVYLNTPEQIQAFENASGLKLESIPVNKAKAPAERDDEELIVRVKKPLTVVYSNNPDYDETSDDKKPKRLFERWEGQSNVLPLDTSANGAQPERTPQQALKGNGPDERTITPAKPENAANANVGANNGKSGYKDGDLMNAVLKTIYANNVFHMKKSLKVLNDSGALQPLHMTLDEAIEVVRNRHAEEAKDVPA